MSKSADFVTNPVSRRSCSSDRIKFAQQDDADDVHNKPEEGSLTFSEGELTGWVKFPGQKAVRIYGKRWGSCYIYFRGLASYSYSRVANDRTRSIQMPSEWRLYYKYDQTKFIVLTAAFLYSVNVPIKNWYHVTMLGGGGCSVRYLSLPFNKR